jgi:mono/diheme cytochrome c family protein
MRPSKLLFPGMAIGLLAWAVILGMRLNPTTNLSRLTRPGAGTQARVETQSAAQLYAMSCANCHQSQGQGRFPVFPPLAGSPWVTGDAGQLVSLALHGRSGPMSVNGVAYSGLMPAFDHLSDQELALVISYTRRSWGNDASQLSEADVAAIRAASKPAQ